MSIVKMKRLQLMGLKDDQDELLRRFMALGCLELTEIHPEGEAAALFQKQETCLALQQERLSRINGALDVVQGHTSEKTGLFSKKDTVSEDVLFGDGVIEQSMELAATILEENGTQMVDKYPVLKLSADRLGLEVAWEEAKEKILISESVFLLEGWLEASKEAAIGAQLDEFTCAWEITDPTPEETEDMPVNLQSSKLTEMLYRGGKRRFRPLAMETKYHDLVR